MNSRSRLALVQAAVIIVCGLTIRRAPLHLLPVVVKYGGSVLWGAMVYALFVALFPRPRPLQIGIAASVFSVAVELFKLVHTPFLDAFRMTLAGQLLIGRFFFYTDIIAYLVAIFISALIDGAALKKPKKDSG